MISLLIYVLVNSICSYKVLILMYEEEHKLSLWYNGEVKVQTPCKTICKLLT
jgi:hypothetical protein